MKTGKDWSREGVSTMRGVLSLAAYMAACFGAFALWGAAAGLFVFGVLLNVDLIVEEFRR